MQSNIMRGIIGVGVVLLVSLLLLGTTSRPATTDTGRTQDVAVSVPSPIASVIPTIIVEEPTIPVATPLAQPSPIQPAIVLERNYGAWGFQVFKHPDFDAETVIRYNGSSIEGVQEYAAANKALAKQLASDGGEVGVSITFRNFVLPEQFRTWAIRKGLRVTDADLRVIDAAGAQGTLSVSPQGGKPQPDGGDPLSQEVLDRALEPQRKITGSPGSILGVYHVRARVEASRLPAVADDPLVFLADVTPNIVRKELAASKWKEAATTDIRIDPPSPFLEMEKFGLDNFKP